MAGVFTLAAVVIMNTSVLSAYGTDNNSEGSDAVRFSLSDDVLCADIESDKLSVAGETEVDLSELSRPDESMLSDGSLENDVAAGIAGATELGVVPTDDELQDIIEAEENAWKAEGALVMADVVTSVNVRAEASEESEIVGKLYTDCGGNIIEYTDDWTKLRSGKVEGWVSNDYLLFGEDAEKLYKEVGVMQATVTGQTLRVRKEASIDAEVLGMVAEGDVFEEVSENDGWVVIDFEGADGYISSEYVTTEFVVDCGETMAAIEAREAAKAAAARKAAESKNSSSKTSTKPQTNDYYGAYAASATDEVLLGALIQCEAGNQPYEAQVAVGAVVMNRVRSSAYPSTIYDVIYASGQFTPAGNGKVDRVIANGVMPICLQAAQEALSGYSNVGGATHFRRVGYHDGIVIGVQVFW
ncbi:MAG: cell wall hydrolase [Lachnospiraceae bacterium]|nr:cell wall hydrolase [Lachnospiraceae bacterium]